jgi:hypothetical protein
MWLMRRRLILHLLCRLQVQQMIATLTGAWQQAGRGGTHAVAAPSPPRALLRPATPLRADLGLHQRPRVMQSTNVTHVLFEGAAAPMKPQPCLWEALACSSQAHAAARRRRPGLGPTCCPRACPVPVQRRRLGTRPHPPAPKRLPGQTCAGTSASPPRARTFLAARPAASRTAPSASSTRRSTSCSAPRTRRRTPAAASEGGLAAPPGGARATGRCAASAAGASGAHTAVSPATRGQPHPRRAQSRHGRPPPSADGCTFQATQAGSALACALPPAAGRASASAGCGARRQQLSCSTPAAMPLPVPASWLRCPTMLACAHSPSHAVLCAPISVHPPIPRRRIRCRSASGVGPGALLCRLITTCQRSACPLALASMAKHATDMMRSITVHALQIIV